MSCVGLDSPIEHRPLPGDLRQSGPSTLQASKYTLRGLYVHGQYRFHRHVDAIWTCTIGSTTKNLDANFDYVFRPTKVQLVGGVWVASKLEGSLKAKGNEQLRAPTAP
jgi:hypothetical protein